MLHLPHDVDVPALHIGGLILDTLERNFDLDFVAVFRELTLGAEHEILTQVRRNPAGQRRRPGAGENLSLLDDGSVHLHAEWIDGEDVGLSMVVEGAEQDLDVVVS